MRLMVLLLHPSSAVIKQMLRNHLLKPNENPARKFNDEGAMSLHVKNKRCTVSCHW